MKISYNETNDVTRLAAADIMLKREAIDSALADIQTDRATSELARKAKEQDLRAEQNRLTEELRKLQKANLA